MYSVVLAATMMTTPVAPDFGGRFRNGCSGCMGCAGCSGGSGLFSGGFLGFGILFPSSSRYGPGCMGCSGCTGSYAMSCYGGVSCYGGCYGSAYGYSGVYAEGPSLDPALPMAPPLMAGGILSFEPPLADGPGVTALPPPYAPRPSELLPPATVDVSANFATVVVSLPADARLFVEGQEWTADAGLATRTFRTPPIDPGRLYYYAFRMEVQRGGRAVQATEEVRLQAGKTARVTFAEPATGTSRYAAQFAVLRRE